MAIISFAIIIGFIVLNMELCFLNNALIVNPKCQHLKQVESDMKIRIIINAVLYVESAGAL